jgi:chemotaxis protein CheD
MKPPPGKHHLIQGEYKVASGDETVISTILGSCVAACLRDPVARIGGMNHFLLPGNDLSREGMQYGAFAMEVLINALLKAGASRDRLEAKLFGGARMLQGLTDIGEQNAQFARRFLTDEGIAYLGGSLGGTEARRVLFWPATGVARQQRLAHQESTFTREAKPAAPSDGGDLELFSA